MALLSLYWRLDDIFSADWVTNPAATKKCGVYFPTDGGNPGRSPLCLSSQRLSCLSSRPPSRQHRPLPRQGRKHGALRADVKSAARCRDGLSLADTCYLSSWQICPYSSCFSGNILQTDWKPSLYFTVLFYDISSSPQLNSFHDTKENVHRWQQNKQMKKNKKNYKITIYKRETYLI